MKIILPFFLAILLIISCQETITRSTSEPTEVIFIPDSSDSNKIYIRDNTDKLWDITHAVNEYGFDPNRFQYGLGPFAIRPILVPKYITADDPEFNEIPEDDKVLGVLLNGSARAYNLALLRRHEIANEKFDTTFVAVGY